MTDINAILVGRYRHIPVFLGHLTALLLVLSVPFIASVEAQGQGQPGIVEQEKLLEGLRSGRIPITDELITMQKRLRPELANLSNAEIRERLEALKGGEPEHRTSSNPDDYLSQIPVGADAESKAAQKAAQKADPDKESIGAAESERPTGRFPAGLRKFGYDFFDNAARAAISQIQQPSLPGYVLSPGDELQVYTWGRENRSQSLTVDKDGMVHIPPLSPLRIAGMAFSEAQESIVRELQNIHGVKASVSLGRMQSIRIFVLGEAVSPGSYVVPAGATVTTALFLSGGVRGIGSLRQIQLRRGGATAATLDLYEMLLSGSTKGDQQLLPGDAIFIPVAAHQVAVTGKVKRPAIYEMKAGERVMDALRLAGGLAADAYNGKVKLDRIEAHTRKVVLEVPIQVAQKDRNLEVRDGDILWVDEVLAEEHNMVFLKGNVQRPGRYEFKSGMTVKDLLKSDEDLKPETYFAYAQVHRPARAGSPAALLPFSLQEVVEGKSVMALEPRDTVIIYQRWQVMEQPVVKVKGEVRNNSEYPYFDNMRVADLIIAAGGLTQQSYLGEAHIIRQLPAFTAKDLATSTLVKVDLRGLVQNPDDPSNVRLEPYDSLIVFRKEHFLIPRSVSVHGAVHEPGSFELTDNMGVREVISQAGGLLRSTYRLQVEVVRRVVEGDSLVRRNINNLSLTDLVEGRQEFPLQDGDGIYIREMVDWNRDIQVKLTGAFAFPGSYKVTRGEKLSNVIRRAGGFRERAYLPGAVFIRERVKEQQLAHLEEIGRKLQSQLEVMAQRTVDEKERASLAMAAEQRRSLLEDIREAPYLGRIVIELDRDMEFAGSDYDITLENGDSLHIGDYPTTISILGEVYSPTNVVFNRKTRTIGRALNHAGGVSEYGDKNNIYYVRPDGSIITPKSIGWWGSYRATKVEPGGTIIVPPKGPKNDWLGDVTKVTQILYHMAITVGVAKTLF